MKQTWVVVYNKPLSEDSPLDMESHGFEVEARNASQALEIVKQSLDSSWNRYLFDVVKQEQFEALVLDVDKYDIPVYLHSMPTFRASDSPLNITLLGKLRGLLAGVSL